jgi:hypothetical protein
VKDSFSGVGGAWRIRREDFERDIPVQVFVASSIDLAHAASAELFYDSVVRDDLAD